MNDNFDTSFFLILEFSYKALEISKNNLSYKSLAAQNNFLISLLIINNNCIQVIGMDNFQMKVMIAAKPKQQSKKKISKPNLIKLSHKNLRKLAQQSIKPRRTRATRRTQTIGPRQIVFSLNKQEYNCPICLQLLIYPSSLFCGHTYCLPCLQNMSKANYKKQCSVCRAEDSIQFHQINQNVQLIISCIHTLRLSEKEKTQYQSRILAHKQQFQSRGVKGSPKKNDLVRLKVNNHWIRGRIIEVINKGSSIFYEIFTLLSEDRHVLSKASINIKQQKIQKPQKTIKYSNCIFSQNIFIQETFPARQPSNTYNIQQLIWQVSYYQPQQVHHSSWNFQFSHRLLQDAIEQQRIRNSSYQGLPIASIDGQTG